MNIFATDLDSTIIVNLEPENLDEYVCVSKTPRGASYISKINLKKLHDLNKLAKIIPVTTRGFSSYNTINLGIQFEYALIDNGAILLVNNKINEDWIKESRKIIKDDKQLFNIGYQYLIENGFTSKTNSEFTIDFTIDEITLEERDIHYLQLKKLIGDKFDVFKAGTRGIYATHKKLNKGNNLNRLANLLNFNGNVVVAGDSKSDWSMMKNYELSIGLTDSPASYQFQKELFNKHKYNYIDYVLNTAINIFSNM